MVFDNAAILFKVGALVKEIRLDLRGLEPPEPLERVLTALSTLASNQRLVIVIPREPVPLYRILARNGYAHNTVLRDDGLFEITVWEERGSAK